MRPPFPKELAVMPSWFWTRLAAACEDDGDPWRFPVLATAGDDGPEARVVVLRAADPGLRRIRAYTDARAPKARQIARDGGATWVFFDPAEWIQARVKVRARVDTASAEAAAALAGVPESHRGNYRGAVPPGGEIRGGEGAGPEGEAHFGVVDCELLEADLLRVERSGQRRARISWVGGAAAAVWLAP